MNTSDYQKQQSQAIDSYYATQAKITQMKRSGASEEQIQAQQQKAEHFQNLTNSLTTNIAVSQAVDAASNAVQNIIDNAASSVTTMTGGTTDTANNVVNSVNNTVSQLSDTASKLLKTSETMIDKASQSVKDLLAADNGGIDKLFGGDAKTTENANKLATPADKGQKEADAKMKEVSAEDASSAIAKPVSFVTKQVTEVVSGTTSAVSTVSKETVDTTSKLGKSLKGTGISDVQSAISKVSNDLVKQTSAATSSIGNFVSSATGTINNTISSVASGVTSTISGITDSISSSIKGITNGTDGVMSSVMSTVKSGITATKSFVTPIMEAGNSIIETGHSISSQIASAFPESIGKYINSASDSYFNSLTDKLANSKLGNVSKILAKLDGVSEKGDILSTFASLKGLYASNTDANGNPIASNGSADSSTSDKLYKLAQQLCGDGITNNSGKDFSFDKDFYDILMALAADLGMSDLIKQLADCGSSKNYFDSRTLNMLKSKLPDVSKSGNPTALSGIVDTVGSHNVSKFSDKIKVLIGNTTSDTAKEQQGVISRLIENASVSAKSLCESASSVIKSFDAKSVALMTSTNTTVVDKAIGKDNRAMIQATLLAYET